MQVIVDLPDDLASELQSHQGQLPRILELGLRELAAPLGSAYEGTTQVLETLATLPTPEEVLLLRPSAALQARITELLERNRAQGLSESEEKEWQRYEYVEHLVRIAKAKAKLKIKAS